MAATQIIGTLVRATALDIWLGTCEPCGRGVRTADGRGDRCMITCPACGAGVAGERVYGTVTEQPCDSRCMGASGPSCSCGCGGVNHGGAWQETGEALASAIEALAARREVAARKERSRADAAAARFNRWAAPHRDLIDAILANDLGGDFLGDLADQLRARRELSDRQLEAAGRVIEAIAARKARQAEQDARKAEFEASGKTVPAGKVTFTGEVVTIRYEESNFGYSSGSFKCLILTDDGYRVWGTMPGALVTQARNEEVEARREWDSARSMRGRRVELTATVSPKAGEPGFGFFSRPRGRLLAGR